MSSSAPRGHWVLDLTEVSFFAECGLTVLGEAAQRARATGVVLRLVADTRPVLLVLELLSFVGVLGPPASPPRCRPLLDMNGR